MSKKKKKEIDDYEFELAHRFKYHTISHMCATGLCPHCGGKKTRTDTSFVNQVILQRR